ncbi:MAG: MaoC/PaaZ C-terminal domain-containing protein [Halioglobus sp.]
MPAANVSESERLARLAGRRVGPYLSHNPVSATQIWQWCAAMGDRNPSYLPGDGQIAPPAMMQMWTMRDINDRYAPGSTAAPPYQVFDDLKDMGYPANVAVSYEISFLRYLRPGERALHYSSVVNISGKKTTALGAGYFVTERVEYLTGRDNPFAEALITYFQYQPATVDATREAGTAEARDKSAATGVRTSQVRDGWRPDFRDIRVSDVRVGDRLPALVIPVSHKLIVAGAIATQDFIPVHHSVPAARAAGMPDIFMNILTTSGLSARYLSDWAGAGSRLRQLSFTLKAPNLPGDTMVMEGTVTAVEQDASGGLVTVAFSGRNGLGIHTSGAAALLLPGM